MARRFIIPLLWVLTVLGALVLLFGFVASEDAENRLEQARSATGGTWRIQRLEDEVNRDMLVALAGLLLMLGPWALWFRWSDEAPVTAGHVVAWALSLRRADEEAVTAGDIVAWACRPLVSAARWLGDLGPRGLKARRVARRHRRLSRQRGFPVLPASPRAGPSAAGRPVPPAHRPPPLIGTIPRSSLRPRVARREPRGPD